MNKFKQFLTEASTTRGGGRTIVAFDEALGIFPKEIKELYDKIIKLASRRLSQITNEVPEGDIEKKISWIIRKTSVTLPPPPRVRAREIESLESFISQLSGQRAPTYSIPPSKRFGEFGLAYKNVYDKLVYIVNEILSSYAIKTAGPSRGYGSYDVISTLHRDLRRVLEDFEEMLDINYKEYQGGDSLSRDSEEYEQTILPVLESGEEKLESIYYGMDEDLDESEIFREIEEDVKGVIRDHDYVFGTSTNLEDSHKAFRARWGKLFDRIGVDPLSINDDHDFLSVMSEIEDPTDRSSFKSSRNAVMALNRGTDTRSISDFLLFTSKIAKEAGLPLMSKFLGDISKKRKYASKSLTSIGLQNNLRESKSAYSGVRYVMKTIKSKD